MLDDGRYLNDVGSAEEETLLPLPCRLSPCLLGALAEEEGAFDVFAIDP